MSESPKPKRTYNSTRRQAQATQTRRLIVEAARMLFDQRGYASTTIEAIAQEAGVAPETVYAAFGSKQAILRRLFEVTVGDEEPVPLLERPDIQENLQSTDPHAMIRRFAQDMFNIMSRMSPIFLLMRTTAKSDPEIGAMLDRVYHDRMGGMGMFVNRLRQIAKVRFDQVPNQAIATVWAVSSAEVFDLLVRVQGWSEEQYVNWLSDTLERLLLE